MNKVIGFYVIFPLPLGESGFAYGRSKASLDSEQIEQSMPLGIIAKFCERGVNPRQGEGLYAKK